MNKVENVDEIIISKLKSLNLHELSSLIEKIKEEFGLDNINFVNNQTSDETNKEKEESKNTFSLILKKIGDQKLSVLKYIQTIINADSILKVKKYTDTLPFVILSDISRQKADEIRVELESKGAEVEIK